MTLPRRLAAWVIVGAVLAAPWAFGSVEPRWIGLLAALIAGAAAVAALDRAARGDPESDLTGGARALVAWFVLLSAVPLVPLPAAVVDLFNGAFRDVIDQAAPPAHAGTGVLSLAPSAGLEALLVAVACAGVVWCVGSAARDERVRDRLVLVVILGGMALAAFGLVQRLVEPSSKHIYWTVELFEVGTPFGPFVNRNHFAGAMLLFAGLAAGDALAARHAGRRGRGRIAMIALVTIVVALAATTSRGGLVGLAAAMAALVALLRGADRRRALLGVAALICLVVAALVASGLLSDLTERLGALQSRWKNRFLVQRDALTVAARFPVLGTGPGTFEAVYPPFQRIDDVRHFSGAHSDWVQFLMETGLSGLVFAVVSTAAFLRRVRTAIAADTSSGRFVVGATAGIVGICAHGLVETNLHVPSNAVLFALTLSLAYAASVADRRPVVR